MTTKIVLNVDIGVMRQYSMGTKYSLLRRQDLAVWRDEWKLCPKRSLNEGFHCSSIKKIPPLFLLEKSEDALTTPPPTSPFLRCIMRHTSHQQAGP